MVSSQEKNERRMEVKVGLMHEGWEYCNPDKKRKRLINPRVVCGVYDNAEAFWEEFSARIAKHYDLTDTLVVLCQDLLELIFNKLLNISCCFFRIIN